MMPWMEAAGSCLGERMFEIEQEQALILDK